MDEAAQQEPRYRRSAMLAELRFVELPPRLCLSLLPGMRGGQLVERVRKCVGARRSMARILRQTGEDDLVELRRNREL